MLDDLRMFPHYVAGLRTFLRHRMTTEECRQRIRDTVALRERNFLDLLDRAIYANPRSPFRALLEHAGLELGDTAALVRADGVEGALDRLYEAGVYLTLEELRGRAPVRRGSLELTFAVSDLANPLVTGVIAGRSGGSRSPGRVTLVNFDSATHQSAYWGAFLSAFGLTKHPSAVWYPPIVAGIATVLFEAKLGRRPEHWWLPSPLVGKAGSLKERSLLGTATAVGSAMGRPVPFPRCLPPARAIEVAMWLAEKRNAGTPALLAATPSSAVRVCLAAAEEGLDIAGSFFRMGGEPFTPAKAKIISDAGCTGGCHYFTSELAWLGIACARPNTAGEVHVSTDRVAVREREHTLPSGETVGLLAFTSLHRSLPNVFVNVETDDFGVLERRSCGCELEALGLSLHLHNIRSVEKLTGEGVAFLGERLVALVEEVLPARFGGTAADYQLVERERDGMTRLQVLASPRLGALDEESVVRETFAFLERSGRTEQGMAAVWEAGHTVEVVRADPFVTRASKVLPLHLALEE